VQQPQTQQATPPQPRQAVPPRPTAQPVQQPQPQPVVQPQPAAQPQTSTITVQVNGEDVQFSGKDSYIFVDVFDHITFDLNAGNGRAIITTINGEDAGFIQPIYDGDKIEIYWKEK
jgi:hypothetical protein